MTNWDDDFRGTIGTTFAESEPFWPTRPSAPVAAPNVVYVVLDDVGFADLGCFGGEIDTASMDRLAADGVRFTNFHTTALCSPTRASLLTGRNHHSVGMGVVANWDTGFPGYRGRITRRAATLAEMLRPNGYSTYAVGKWHLVPTDEMTATASTGSSTAVPTTGRPMSSKTTARSTRPSPPTITSVPISPITQCR